MERKKKHSTHSFLMTIFCKAKITSPYITQKDMEIEDLFDKDLWLH